MMKRFILTVAVLAIAVVLLAACSTSSKTEGTSAPGTTTAAAQSTVQTAAQSTTVVTAATTAVQTTKKPAETFVSPDLSLVDFDKEIDLSVKVYNNPLIPEVSMINPFILRYDGVYYLYGSPGRDKDLYTYKSTDLVNWSDPIKCMDMTERFFMVDEHGDEGWASSYAPEVTYFNGKFYLVSSIGGKGHCFFTADSPEGPYKRVNEDMWGCKIDGHIFIDNDGKWYFYSAHSNGGIHIFDMTEPTKVDIPTERNVGAMMDDGAGTWTEGPMVVYHDGVYYLTYTGNHVAHTAYRIDYGISYDGPTAFKEGKGNPVLVSTSDAAAGIGHSSTVKGPDLDSYYIAYHTRIQREYHNIDRIVFNGDVMTVLGPTVSQSAVPSMPDIYSLFDSADDAAKFDGTFTVSGGDLVLGANGRALSKDSLTRDCYTAEITTKNIQKDASAGIIFGYKDENNFGSALFDTKTEELVITFVVNGKATEHREKLVRSFDIAYDFAAVQSIQVEKTGNTFTFYVNDREIAKHESTLDGSKIGAMTKGGSAEFGFLGATAATGGNSTKDHYKPVATQTGYILSTHCREWDIKTAVREDTKEVYLKASQGETYNYSVYAEKLGKYSLATCYRSEKGATLSIFVDGVYVRDVKLSATKDIATEIVRDIDIGYKGHVITIYVREGEADIFYYRCQTTLDKDIKEVFDKTDKGLSYSDGTKWSIKDGSLSTSGICKRLYGSYLSGDYRVSASVKAAALGYAFGILVRATNPAEPTKTQTNGMGGYMVVTDDSAAAKGINWMQGYYVEIYDKGDEVKLFKCSYDRKLLKSEKYTLKHNVEYKLEVVCIGATITVYIDGNEVLTYTDPEPFINGMAGFRNGVATGKVYFDDLEIRAIK